MLSIFNREGTQFVLTTNGASGSETVKGAKVNFLIMAPVLKKARVRCNSDFSRLKLK
jgi:hypothetical protein